MPSIASGKVLVTGCSGFIATWVARKLLEQGYSVRGTVRSPSRGKYPTKLFAEYGDNFELAFVEEMTNDGAFDSAVQGVDAILHMASPVHLHAVHPSEMIDPAVAGTVSILESARKFGTSVKRIIITSSAAAIVNTLPHPETFDETSWNHTSVEACEAKGKDAAPLDKYRASKALAERAAWNYMAQNKRQLSFDLVVINPPYVFGPVLHQANVVEELNASMLEWYETILKGAKEDALLKGTSWVDVRDVAEAHVLALQTEEAGGERIIVCSGPGTWLEWIRTARSLDLNIPARSADIESAVPVCWYNLDNSKGARILGLQYFNMEESTRDILAQFKEKGWW